jgi:hypothetical protein
MPFSKSKSYTIKGYLCIDAKDKHIFNEAFDPMLVQGLAEDVHDYLDAIIYRK